MLFANAVFLRLFGQCINKRHGQFPSKDKIFLTAGVEDVVYWSWQYSRPHTQVHESHPYSRKCNGNLWDVGFRTRRWWKWKRVQGGVRPKEGKFGESEVFRWLNDGSFNDGSFV